MTYWPDHSPFGNQINSKVDDPKPFTRGINSIQLFYDGARWWIMSICWQHESPEHPVPENYL
jgi:hypothetical protein